MFCTMCGKQIPDDAAFCTNCGNKIQQEEKPEPTPEVVQEIFEEEATRIMVPKSNINDEMTKIAFSKSEPSSEKIVENEVLSSSDENVDIYSNSVDEDIDISSDSVEETDIYSNSVNTPVDVYSNSSVADDNVNAVPEQDNQNIYSHSADEFKIPQPEIVPAPVPVAKPVPAINQEPKTEPIVHEIPMVVETPYIPPQRNPVQRRPERFDRAVTMTEPRPGFANNQPAQGNPNMVVNPVPQYVPNPELAKAKKKNKKKKKIHPMAIILPIMAIVLVVAIIFGSVVLFGGNPKDKYYTSKMTSVYYSDGQITSKDIQEYRSYGQMTHYKSGDYEVNIEYSDDDRINKYTRKQGDEKMVLKFEYEKDGSLYVASDKAEWDGVTLKMELTYNKSELVSEKEYHDNELVYLHEIEENTETVKYFTDGELSSTYISEYDKNDRLIREKRVYNNGEGDETEIIEYSYDKKGNLISEYCMNDNNEVTYYSLYEYDKNFNCISQTNYDADDNVIYQSGREYNKYDILVSGETYGEDEELINRYELESETKDEVVVNQYDENDSLVMYYVYKIEKGKKVQMKGYDADGNLVEEETYNDIGLVTEAKYYYDGSLYQKSTYEYAKK